MELGGSSVATYVAIGGIIQTIYYTVLIATLASRISSRIAVMEFKVNEPWARARNTDGDL